MWKVVFTRQAQKDAKKIATSGLKSKAQKLIDILKQNPELMQQFTQAAVSSMSRENPGFGGFMSGVMGGGMPMQPPASGPPGPTPEMRERPPRMPRNMRRGGRPDVGMARGVATFNDAINMEEKFSNRPGTKREAINFFKTRFLLNPKQCPFDKKKNLKTSVQISHTDR